MVSSTDKVLPSEPVTMDLLESLIMTEKSIKTKVATIVPRVWNEYNSIWRAKPINYGKYVALLGVRQPYGIPLYRVGEYDELVIQL